ncbi:MAG: phage virion morphogenesis protein [Tistrella sp.]|uniref:Phage virion morphogenesis protein n=1 Tax=Tistrella mobilis TaxID=171437 RepID=A0A3B9IEY9_9PROT|nr:phage virion morphogenesis protein [Tistrella sp.]MAD35455.1 phage virion morphogenesis protein [Tistrella sp.]MBA78472.1 phage virion morphogenesis protein [Tistrella sp.]HAE45847.1 phage virion morphogenesis protein [Tistrella mobilis]
MAGAGLTTVDNLTGPLQALARGLTHPADLIANLGAALVASTKDRFLTETAPDGSAWEALNPLYAKGKKGPGILREGGAMGGLMSTIVWQADGDRRLEVGTNRIYAAAHQFGAIIVPKTAAQLVFEMAGRLFAADIVVIPARPYLGLSQEDAEDMLDLAADYVQGLLTR